MRKDNHKPPRNADEAKASATPRRATVTNNNTGRVTHDERGNAIWEWAVSTGAIKVDTTTQRVRKLDNPGLSLAADAPTPFDGVKENPHGTLHGYSPYDSGLLVKKETGRKKDLKKLSDWLQQKRQNNGHPVK